MYMPWATVARNVRLPLDLGSRQLQRALEPTLPDRGPKTAHEFHVVSLGHARAALGRTPNTAQAPMRRILVGPLPKAMR